MPDLNKPEPIVQFPYGSGLLSKKFEISKPEDEPLDESAQTKKYILYANIDKILAKQ
jgi:hypothetical protein